MRGTRKATGFFIAGTDTGVGKTFATCSLAAGLRKRGQKVGVMKPVETGVRSATIDASQSMGQGEINQHDSVLLRNAAQVEDSLDLISPLRFSLPAAPNVAAKFENRQVDLACVRDAFAKLQKRHEILLVESAGGLLSPFDDTRSMADLARILGLPILLVTRAALGAIHHTRACLEAARAHELCIAGVLISHTHFPLAIGEPENLAFLRSELGELLWGELPFAKEIDSNRLAQNAGSDAFRSTQDDREIERGFFWERILRAIRDPLESEFAMHPSSQE